MNQNYKTFNSQKINILELEFYNLWL